MKLKQFTDLSRRVLVSAGIIILVGLLIGFAGNPFVRVLIVAAVAAMAGVGVWEYTRLAATKGLKPAAPLMIVIAILVVISFFIAHMWIHTPELPVFVFAVGVGLFFLNRFRRSEEALIHVAVELFGVAYVAVPLSYMLAILYPVAPPSEMLDGRWWLVYLLVVTKITDIGAYFVGRLWGKRRLAPVLSPKKTIEGALGGFVCAILGSLAMVYIGQEFAGKNFPLHPSDAIWLGIVIGIFGQIGDLAESLLKRDAAMKDSNTLPGLGGILDMLDSLIFTAPIVYFYLRWYSTA